MKKILLATSALALSAGVASAEINLSGSAVMGLDYNGGAAAGSDKVTTLFETYVTFGATVESDAGLTFGMSKTIATYNTDDVINNDGTTVSMSGAFGTLTMGSVAEADEVAGLSDVGLTGIGVDDVAENTTGDSSGGRSHNVHYAYSAGGFDIAVSTRLGAGTAAAKNAGSAIGLKYTFGDYYVGLGYNDTDIAVGVGARDGVTTSLYAGGTVSGFGVKAMYAEHKPDAGGKIKSAGLNASYTTGAATISMAVAKSSIVANTAYGLGVSYDLGGGASVVGGIGKNGAGDSRAQLGVSFSF